MGEQDKTVSRSRMIAAEPSTIFAVLADPAQHGIIDGSGTIRSSRSDTHRLELGDRFGMNMRIGLPYIIKNEVVELEEDRRIAWRHVGRHIWRYELEPVDGATLVTETFDYGPSLSTWFIEAVGYPERHGPAIEKTLERLDTYVTTGEVPTDSL